MYGGRICENEAEYGGGVCIDGGAEFVFQSLEESIPRIFSNTATRYGGGVYLDEESTFTMDGTYIYGNTALACGGGVYVSGESTFDFYNGFIGLDFEELESPNRAENGAGVYVRSGTFTMDGSDTRVSYNEAWNCGGGVFVYMDGTFNLIDGSISSNMIWLEEDGEKDAFGGGVFVYGTFNMEGGIIESNIVYASGSGKAGFGGGVYIGYTMDGDDASPEFNFTNGSINDNSAQNGAGGGVFVDNGSTFNMSVEGEYAEIMGNFALYYGGGVYVDEGSTFNFESGDIWNNSASYGGGIYVNDSTFITAEYDDLGACIYYNEAIDGGGIYFDGDSYGTIYENTAIYENEAQDNGDGAAGGGIVVVGFSEVTMDGGEITNNTVLSADPDAYLYGGGVYVDSYGVFYLLSGRISENRVVCYEPNSFGRPKHDQHGNVIGDYAGVGGGIFSLNEVYIQGGEISSNSASYGGGVAAQWYVEFSGGTISKNGANYGAGVCVISSDGTFYMYNASASIVENVANYRGGGVFAAEGSTFFMDDGEISRNHILALPTETPCGAGVYMDTSTFVMNNGLVADNYCQQYKPEFGGGIEVDENGVKQIQSNGYGAGVYVYEGVFTMNGGMITGKNVTQYTDFATYYGAGIYNYKGNVEINETDEDVFAVIEDNEAYEIGGGIYNDAGSVEINGGVIRRNKANDGAGVYCFGRTTIDGDPIMAYLSISGTSTISDNFAYLNGGGVYLDENSNLFMEGGVLALNRAGSVLDGELCGGRGGGIFVGANASLDMYGGLIGGHVETESEGILEGYTNDAVYGGGVFVDAGGEFSMVGGTIDYNTASGYDTETNNVALGGGICSYGFLAIDGGTISKNLAVSIIDGVSHYGGGVYASRLQDDETDNAKVLLSSGLIYENQADFGGGFFIDSGVSFTVRGDDSYIYNNQADFGGGIYVNDGSTFNMNGGEIYSNIANRNGGGVFVNDESNFIIEKTGETAPQIYSNSAECGGGIYFDNISTGTIKDACIDLNIVTAYGGGIVVSYGSEVTMTSGEILQNYVITLDENVVISGGGVYVDYYSVFTLESGTISNNQLLYCKVVGDDIERDKDGNPMGEPYGYGGGIYAIGTVYLNGGTISNHEVDYGGGIALDYYKDEQGQPIPDAEGYAIAGQLQITGGLIDSNSAYSCGGGLYLGTYTYLVMNGGTVSNCEAGYGGGIYLTGANAEITSGEDVSPCITGNYAYGDGGGVYLDNGSTMYFMGGLIGSNGSGYIDNGEICGGNGGGVCIATGSSLIMSGGNIGNIEEMNYAFIGGGVCILENETYAYYGENSEIVVPTSTLIIIGGSISHNYAMYGGGVYNDSSTLQVGGSAEIIDNFIWVELFPEQTFPEGTSTSYDYQDNVHLSNSAIDILDGELAPVVGEMLIGVTQDDISVPLVTANAKIYTSCFDSDNSVLYVDSDKDGALYLYDVQLKIQLGIYDKTINANVDLTNYTIYYTEVQSDTIHALVEGNVVNVSSITEDALGNPLPENFDYASYYLVTLYLIKDGKAHFDMFELYANLDTVNPYIQVDLSELNSAIANAEEILGFVNVDYSDAFIYEGYEPKDGLYAYESRIVAFQEATNEAKELTTKGGASPAEVSLAIEKLHYTKRDLAQVIYYTPFEVSGKVVTVRDPGANAQLNNIAYAKGLYENALLFNEAKEQYRIGAVAGNSVTLSDGFYTFQISILVDGINSTWIETVAVNNGKTDYATLLSNTLIEVYGECDNMKGSTSEALKESYRSILTSLESIEQDDISAVGSIVWRAHGFYPEYLKLQEYNSPSISTSAVNQNIVNITTTGASYLAVYRVVNGERIERTELSCNCTTPFVAARLGEYVAYAEFFHEITPGERTAISNFTVTDVPSPIVLTEDKDGNITWTVQDDYSISNMHYKFGKKSESEEEIKADISDYIKVSSDISTVPGLGKGEHLFCFDANYANYPTITYYIPFVAQNIEEPIVCVSVDEYVGIFAYGLPEDEIITSIAYKLGEYESWAEMYQTASFVPSISDKYCIFERNKLSVGTYTFCIQTINAQNQVQEHFVTLPISSVVK